MSKSSFSEYTPELGEEICDLVAQGWTVSRIALKLGRAEHVINRWKNEIKEFGAAVSAAKSSFNGYTPGIGEEICELISEGWSVSSIALKVGRSVSAINRWKREIKEFGAAVDRAREEQADFYADEIMVLADDEDLTPESRRVRIEARKWLASKRKPKVYGDKTILSGDAENPIAVLATRLDQAIERKRERERMIDVTPARVTAEEPPEYSDLC